MGSGRAAVGIGDAFITDLASKTFLLLAIDQRRNHYQCRTFLMAVLKRDLSSHQHSQSRKPSPRLRFNAASASCRHAGMTNSLRLSYQCSKPTVCCERPNTRPSKSRPEFRHVCPLQRALCAWWHRPLVCRVRNARPSEVPGAMLRLLLPDTK